MDVDASATEKLQHKYEYLHLDIPLYCEQAPYRNINETMLHHIEEEARHLKPQQTLTTVSYTHLDVYKRQYQHLVI